MKKLYVSGDLASKVDIYQQKGRFCSEIWMYLNLKNIFLLSILQKNNNIGAISFFRAKYLGKMAFFPI